MSQIISFYVDETHVRGRVTYCDPYDVSVEITEPFSGFSTSCHIPCLARNNHNYKGVRGHQKALELLSDLYFSLLNFTGTDESIKLARE